MKYITAIVFSFLSLNAVAEDGLVTQFVITKTIKISEESETRKIYNSAVLVNFNEVNTIDFKDQYTFKITTRSDDFKKVNVLINLKDISTGKPYYVGGHAMDLTVGDSTSFKLTPSNTNITYSVELDTSYGKLP
ncbi:MAG: hypothetical protein ACSHW0_19385 [Thalassotalea sp.]